MAARASGADEGEPSAAAPIESAPGETAAA
jgi:hypothetical protein